MMIRRRSAIDIYRQRASNGALLSGRRQEATEHVNRRILDALGPVSSLLDVGCGDGSLLKAIGAGLGIAPTTEEINFLRKTHPQIQFQAGVATSIPVPDQSFDTIVMNGVIMLFPSLNEAEKAISELSRVAKPGAKIWLGEALYRRDWAQVFSQVKGVARAWRHFRRAHLPPALLLTPEQWVIETAKRHGLHLVSSYEHGPVRKDFLFKSHFK